MLLQSCLQVQISSVAAGSIRVLRAHRGGQRHWRSRYAMILPRPDLPEVLHELDLVQTGLRVGDLLVALRARALLLFVVAPVILNSLV